MSKWSRIAKKRAKKKQFVANLVEKATPAELRLKELLDCAGIEYEFQKPIGPFVVDFCLPRVNTILEVDGGYHNANRQFRYDERRTIHLEKHGWFLLRVTNDDVLNKQESTMARISMLCVRS